MIFKVGNIWYKVGIGGPLMVVLSRQDKAAILAMPEDAYMYAEFANEDPNFETNEQKYDWMIQDLGVDPSLPTNFQKVSFDEPSQVESVDVPDDAEPVSADNSPTSFGDPSVKH
jgi:hypothetical protein